MCDRVTVVLLTYNCAHRIGAVLEHLRGLPVVAVDNASTDGTVDVLRRAAVDVIALPANIGAAARNIGLERARTPYVAFCDDDGWPDAVGLQIAADLLDAHPRLALIAARVFVRAEKLDPLSAEMAASPLPADDGIPGVPVLGFMAGAVVVRVAAYRQAGGYDPEFFIHGEESDLAIRLARLGWQLRYVPDVVVHHYPSLANAPRLRAVSLRNALWTAWLHRRLAGAVGTTVRELARRPKDAAWIRGVLLALRGAGWVWRRRDPVPPELDAQLREVSRPHRSGRPAGMATTQSEKDVVDYLVAQHNRIKALFEQVLPTVGEQREQVFLELRRLLAVHETAEEQIVHPRARHEIASGERIVDARLEEENEAKQALADLESLDVDSPEFEQRFAKLQTAVLEHAEREEHEEFGQLREQLDAEQLQRMRKAAELAEQIGPTRPHAGVESAGANLLVGPFASMLDRVRDVINSVSR